MKDQARSNNYLPTQAFPSILLKKVLVVDSNPFVARQMEQLISQLQHIPMGCVSTIEAVEECISINKPDLILINIETRGNLDGYQIAKILKLDYEIPFCILYDEKITSLKKWAEELNPDSFLSYSNDRSILIQQLETILD